jgi:hypothetical protein
MTVLKESCAQRPGKGEILALSDTPFRNTPITTNLSISPSSSPTPIPYGGNSAKVPVGAIVGIACGGAFIFALIVAALGMKFSQSRRHRKAYLKNDLTQTTKTRGDSSGSWISFEKAAHTNYDNGADANSGAHATTTQSVPLTNNALAAFNFETDPEKNSATVHHTPSQAIAVRDLFYAVRAPATAVVRAGPAGAIEHPTHVHNMGRPAHQFHSATNITWPLPAGVPVRPRALPGSESVWSESDGEASPTERKSIGFLSRHGRSRKG